jgi:sugar phosphate isomerase/epimerase
MDIGVSTCVFGEASLSPTHLDQLLTAGYTQIELYANRPHLDYHNRTRVKELSAWFESNITDTPSLHLPFFEGTRKHGVRHISALEGSDRARVCAIDEVKRALEFVDRVDISHVVVHLGIPDQIFSPVQFEYAYSLIQAISEFAGVRILIENITNEVSTLDRIREFLTAIDRPDVGICYDSGHGGLQGGRSDLTGVSAIHLNDFRPDGDTHLWPFEGTLNWPGLAAELVRSNFEGPMLCEGLNPDIGQAAGISERIQSLVDEARSGPKAFARKYALTTYDDGHHLH